MTNNSLQMPQQSRHLNMTCVYALLATSSVVGAPLGLILAVFGIIQARKQGHRGQGFAFAALFLVVVLMPVAVYMLLSGQGPMFNACHALQDQGRGSLRTVHILQESYKSRSQRFGTLEEIGFRSAFGDNPYTIVLKHADANQYEAQAVGNHQMEGDLMILREDGHIQIDKEHCFQ